MTDAEFQAYKTVIQRYVDKNPEEWGAWKIEQEKRRAELANDYGSTGTDSLRLAGNIPQKLELMLRAYTVGHLGKEEYLNRDFLIKFPIFKLAKKI